MEIQTGKCILLRNSKEHTTDKCNNRDESPMHCTRCKKAKLKKKKKKGFMYFNFHDSLKRSKLKGTENQSIVARYRG